MTVAASTPARVPAPQADANRAVSSSTWSRSQVPSDAAIDETAMPTMMKRKPPIPVPRERAVIRRAAPRPPTSAPAVRASQEEPTSTSAVSSPTNAPFESPSTSGLASGLRVTLWNTAPATPSAAPTTTAAAMRGSRHSTTTVRARPSVDPETTPRTSPSGTG
ncbi:hypothetical protein ACH61_03076 [Rathayibacter tanaceti]|uniref:Uncharacterized protein n=1 Tax=Rathayibacter tanaceti TaxID=1671680 RepID=A0A162F6W9_9MICO|nr:hypothetical protein ACH61_03076 [Rathayibacter tanaceti]